MYTIIRHIQYAFNKIFKKLYPKFLKKPYAKDLYYFLNTIDGFKLNTNI